jgi:hypothetical protein
MGTPDTKTIACMLCTYLSALADLTATVKLMHDQICLGQFASRKVIGLLSKQDRVRFTFEHCKSEPNPVLVDPTQSVNEKTARASSGDTGRAL